MDNSVNNEEVDAKVDNIRILETVDVRQLLLS